MRIFAAIALSLVLSVLSLTVLAQRPPGSSYYVVIVHPSNANTVVTRKFMEDAFLKKSTLWPGDEVIRPVDLRANSPVRRKFTEDVLNRSVEAVKGYWQQRIFSGRDVPPPELDADDDVVKYVQKYPGAVGYVSGNAKLEGVKVVAVE